MRAPTAEMQAGMLVVAGPNGAAHGDVIGIRRDDGAHAAGDGDPKRRTGAAERSVEVPARETECLRELAARARKGPILGPTNGAAGAAVVLVVTENLGMRVRRGCRRYDGCRDRETGTECETGRERTRLHGSSSGRGAPLWGRRRMVGALRRPSGGPASRTM
ncbi:Hypothetical protein A7982_00899 [Minicystis rosea]|nr:Hypothetical protein A7982_00899 [Minicystis rosea]